jgi:signal peptidase II
MTKYRFLAWISGTVILLDQITKAAVAKWMPVHGSIPVISGFFDITHIYNPGGAFGFLAGQGDNVRKFFFLFVSSLAVLLILYFYHKTPRSHRWLSFGLALILGGAIGNLMDRFRFGKVLDYLDFYIGELHWPAFNLADSAITVGIFILAWHLLFDKMPNT